MISNFLLYNIITRKHPFCCLCFKTIEGNPINIEDEVFLEKNNTQNTTKIRDLLSLVLGYETLNNVSSFQTVCKQCTHTAVNCYQFIMMTRENSVHLSNVIISLTSCLENTSKSINSSKTLYVTVDSNNITTQHYYDEESVVSSSMALKKLQSILDARIKIKNEINSIKVKNDCQPDKPLRKRRQYFTVPIKTREMLHDKNDATTLKCKACLKLYPSLASLRNHYIRVHAPKNYKCQICNRKFGSPALLEGHKSESHCTVVCCQCGKTFHNRHTLKMHEIGHHFKIVCQDCGRVYKSRSTFKKHKDLNICGQLTRASPADAKFTCDYCNKKYTQKVSLRVHMQYEHGNYKGHECKWCKKTFYAQSRLKAHIVKHTQEKKFLCNMCGCKFITKESLLYHTRTHTGEKPYKCEYCDKRFLSASRRSEHRKLHHSDMIIQHAKIES